jgi:CDP-diacylglycerol--serine O-phosphatidyltransferase
MKQIPNIFTLLNLLFGCLAITAALQNPLVIQYTQDGQPYISMAEKLWLSSIFIFIAAIIDFADGFLARLLKAQSEIGKQLDSLSDVVSFGVAPSMIMYQFIKISIVQESIAIETSLAWLLPAFLIALCAAYRLAKFNLDIRQLSHFKGVPTPAVGLLIASFPLIYWYASNPVYVEVMTNKWFLYGITAGLSFLMVSDIPMMSLKFTGLRISENLPRYLLLVLAVLTFVLISWVAVPIIFISYIILSLIYRKQIQQ